MTSLLAWLDASKDDQRRAREILNLFSETESRDELGIGQIRDAFSDSLFPGTSTLHTRARYLLFIPWCYVEASGRRLGNDAFNKRVDTNERRLLVSLKDAGEVSGLIGRIVGPAIRTLPSSIYWSALSQYNIYLGAGDREHVGAATSGASTESDELVDRGRGPWSATLPQMPAGFPNDVEGGLTLTHDEASWVQERILSGSEGSLLADLLTHGGRPVDAGNAPWEDPSCLRAPTQVLVLLEHARLFSLAIHGAALLYNLELGRRYEAAGLTRIEQPSRRYAERFDVWVGECVRDKGLATWDRTDFWMHVIAQNPRVGSNYSARHFVDTWLDAVIDGRVANLAARDGLAGLVVQRERSIKKGQSRLVNDKLMRTWSGQSGTRTLTYRWDQVKTLVGDIKDGLKEPDAGA
jgi:Family of unknown function (DUF6361)